MRQTNSPPMIILLSFLSVIMLACKSGTVHAFQPAFVAPSNVIGRKHVPIIRPFVVALQAEKEPSAETDKEEDKVTTAAPTDKQKEKVAAALAEEDEEEAVAKVAATEEEEVTTAAAVETDKEAAPVAAQTEEEASPAPISAATDDETEEEEARVASTRMEAEEESLENEKAAEVIVEALGRGGDLIRSRGGALIQSLAQNELLMSILDASGQIAKDIFVVMRRTAANALTASLPEEEREELLERTLGRERVQAARAFAKQFNGDDDIDEQATYSVSESVAAAAAKEKQRDPAQWEKEKEQIYKQVEQAAKERVETELSIQKQRMEQEKRKLTEDAESAQAELNKQKQALEVLQKDIEQEKIALVAEEKETAAAAAKEQNEKLAAMEVALSEKEAQAKKDQQKMEKLAKELEAASKLAPLATKEEKPRVHAGRYTPEEYRSLTEEEKEQVKSLREKEGSVEGSEDEASSSTNERDHDVHPVLGPVIQDLGYKRIHLISAGRLGTIPIWKKQRIYRHERAKSMVNDKWKSMDLGLPGIICLHEDKDGKLAIVDGQHRVGMMMLLRDKQRKAQMEDGDANADSIIDFERVLVEVYPHKETSEDEQHAQDLFLEINKSEPVKLVDMPGVAKAKDRKVITDAVDQLYDLYPDMFSPSQRCRIPNVNVDNMRNNLFGANVMKTHNLTSSKKLVGWLLEQNELLGKKYEGDEATQSEASPKAWKKANSNGFYLGLESSWLYN